MRKYTINSGGKYPFNFGRITTSILRHKKSLHSHSTFNMISGIKMGVILENNSAFFIIRSHLGEKREALRHQHLKLAVEVDDRRGEDLPQGDGDGPHRVRILMGQEGQKRREGAQAGREEDKEGQLFLGVDGDLVEGGQQLPVGAFGATRVRIEEVALLQRVRDQPEGAFPGAMEQIERPVDAFPMLKVEKRVGNGLGIAALQNVLRGQNQRLHFQQIFGNVRIELHGAMNRFHGRNFASA